MPLLSSSSITATTAAGPITPTDCELLEPAFKVSQFFSLLSLTSFKLCS